MGVSCMGRCSTNPYSPTRSGNPNPDLFTILQEETLRSKTGHSILILKVKYPTCTNFEGEKIMVFVGPSSSEELLAATRHRLDPHFRVSHTSPIARFMPDEAGMGMARMFAQQLCATVDKT